MKKSMALTLALALVLALALPVLAAPEAVEATAAAENIQKYGNVVLDCRNEDFLDLGYSYGDVLTVSFLDQSLDIPLCSNYSDVDSGSPALFAREGDEYLLAAINMGDFATTYGIAVKATAEDGSVSWNWAEGVDGPVTFAISLKEAGGYLEEYFVHQLKYTDNRDDYAELSDDEFANFRAVTTTGMGEGVLYRTASPVNPERGRNTYADAAIAKAGVTVIMNLADTEASVKGFLGYDESYYATTNYIALNMGVDFSAPDFQEKLAQGLRFFVENPGVYAIHCTEGKDRAGFVVAVIESLMGASYDEVVADYMTTYYNYFGVTPADARYDAIVQSNIVKSLQKAFGVSDLAAADLAAGAEGYLKGIGLSDEELAALKTNLSGAAAQPAGTPEPEAEPAPEAEPEPEAEPAPEPEAKEQDEGFYIPVWPTANPETYEDNVVYVKADYLPVLSAKLYPDGYLHWRFGGLPGVATPGIEYPVEFNLG